MQSSAHFQLSIHAKNPFMLQERYRAFLSLFQVCQERKEREELKETVSEDREARVGHKVRLMLGFFCETVTLTSFSSSCRHTAGPPLFSATSFPALLQTFGGHRPTPISPIKKTTLSSQRPEFTFAVTVRHLSAGSCTA